MIELVLNVTRRNTLVIDSLNGAALDHMHDLYRSVSEYAEAVIRLYWSDAGNEALPESKMW